MKQTKSWKWRSDELSVKEFYKLPSTEKEEYIFLLEGLKPIEVSTGDQILLNLYSKKKANKFLSLDDITL
jgi:hypothetical protein